VYRRQTGLMQKRQTLFGILALALVTFVTGVLRGAETTYKSKSLSEWLRLYAKAEVNGRDEQRAKEAIRAFGTNAVPQLTWLLTNDDINIQMPALTDLLTDLEDAARYLALSSLARFEKEARPAVTAIVALLADPEEGIREAATNALRQIAPEALTNGLAVQGNR